MSRVRSENPSTSLNRVGIRESHRRTYVSPKLIKYGHISKLTFSASTSTLSDSGSNHMRPTG